MTLRVLVIDDEVGAGAPLRAVLGQGGYESVWFERGEEALRMLERTPFDVIVTELSLGGMDGVELCRRVHALRPGLPVIVRTAAPTVGAAVEAFRAGASDFVAKTEREESVLQAMNRALDRARRSPEAVGTSRGPGDEAESLRSMDEVERQHVLRVLEAVRGNKREAARILKLDRTTLYRKLKRYGVASQRGSGTMLAVRPEENVEDVPRREATG